MRGAFREFPILSQNRAISLLALFLLSGCGGGAGEGDEVPTDLFALSPQERLVAFDEMSERLTALFNTGFTGQPGEVPSDGSAEFVGFTGIALSRAGDDLGLLGITEIKVDFSTRILTGSITDFFGDDGGELDGWTGTVAIRNGEVGFDFPRGDTVPNDLRFDYVGTLAGQGNTLMLDGSVAGKLKGTPIQGMTLVSTGETELLNGAETPATVVVVAEIR